MVGATRHLAATSTFDLLQPSPQFGHPSVNQPSVGFDLPLARTATRANSTLDPLEVSPQPFQTRTKIEQLGQLDLQLRFVGLGPRGEDIQDHLAAVDDDRLQGLFQVAALGRCQVVVENDQLGLMSLDQVDQFFDLATAQAGGRMRPGTDLDQLVDHLHAGRCCQAADLLQRLFAVASLVPVQNADQDAAF